MAKPKKQFNKPPQKHFNEQNYYKGQKKPETKQKLLGEDWNQEYWRERCAWCSSEIMDTSQAFIIPVSLHQAAFREFSPNTIQPLYLTSAGKVVPMIVAGEDSPIKAKGKDAYFQTCCEKCALKLKEELQKSLQIASEP
jgi:hypothetical protein